MHCNWLSLPDTWMYIGHPMIHLTWLDIYSSTDWLYPPDIQIVIDIWHLILFLTVYLLSIFAYYFSLILVIVSFHMLTHYMHVHFFFYFTHSLGRFLTTLELHVQILDVYFIDQVFVEIAFCVESRVSLYLFWYYCLPFNPVVSTVSWSHIYVRLFIISFPVHHHMWTYIYMCIAVIIDLL